MSPFAVLGPGTLFKPEFVTFGRNRAESATELVKRAYELRAAGQYQEAIACFDRALALDPLRCPGSRCRRPTDV